MTLLLTIIITLTIPSESDAAYIAAIACGESCGMQTSAQELIIANLLYDAADHGTGWLPTRWYAPLKPSAKVEALVWSVVEKLARGVRWRRCRLIGSARDRVYWLEHGYAEGEPDLTWGARDMEVNAFGCWWPTVAFVPMECTGVPCPQ